MLKIYLNINDVPEEKFKKWNDLFFEAENRLEDIIKHKKEVSEIIWHIDGSKYTDNNKIISKFDQTSIGLDCLSTGCKTAINVLLNPDKVFSTIGCGYNAVDEILTLDDGQIYLAMDCITDIPKPVIIIKDHTEYVVNNFDEFDALMEEDSDENETS